LTSGRGESHDSPARRNATSCSSQGRICFFLTWALADDQNEVSWLRFARSIFKLITTNIMRDKFSTDERSHPGWSGPWRWADQRLITLAYRAFQLNGMEREWSTSQIDRGEWCNCRRLWTGERASCESLFLDNNCLMRTSLLSSRNIKHHGTGEWKMRIHRFYVANMAMAMTMNKTRVQPMALQQGHHPTPRKRARTLATWAVLCPPTNMTSGAIMMLMGMMADGGW